MVLGHLRICTYTPRTVPCLPALLVHLLRRSVLLLPPPLPPSLNSPLPRRCPPPALPRPLPPPLTSASLLTLTLLSRFGRVVDSRCLIFFVFAGSLPALFRSLGLDDAWVCLVLDHAKLGVCTPLQLESVEGPTRSGTRVLIYRSLYPIAKSMASATPTVAQGASTAVTAASPREHQRTRADPGRPRSTSGPRGPIGEPRSPTGGAGSDALFQQRAARAVTPSSGAGSTGSSSQGDPDMRQVSSTVPHRRPDLELLRKRHKLKLQQRQQQHQKQQQQQQQRRPIEQGQPSPRPASAQRRSQDLSPRPPSPRSRPHSQPVGTTSPRLGEGASSLRRPESAGPQRLLHANSSPTRGGHSGVIAAGGKVAAARGPSMEDVRRAIFFDKNRGKIFKISTTAAESSNAGRIGVLIRLQRPDTLRQTSTADERRRRSGGSGGLVLRFHDAKYPTLLVVANASCLELVEGIAPPSKKPSPRLLVRHRTST